MSTTITGRRVGGATAAALLFSALAAGAAQAATTPHDYDVDLQLKHLSSEQPAPGVTYQEFIVTTEHGASEGDVLEIDLRNPRVSLELLHADHVAQGTTLTEMAADKGAFAAVNADFFNMAYWENNPGLATESADGPEITGGQLRKAAVPAAQRIGPQMSAGATGREVVGVGADGRARVDEVEVDGFVRSARSGLDAEVGGYNQFALPQNSIGVYDEKWGPVTRGRAVCGTDTSRLAPCLQDDVTEVLVRDGKVVEIADYAGSGQLGKHEVVLLGREAGAAELSKLAVGDPVNVKWGAAADQDVPFEWAVGGFPNLADSRLVAGLGANNAGDLAPRTLAGVSEDGLTVFLAVIDGRSDISAGATRVEAAEILRQLGADDGVQLDGGGSTEMILKPTVDAEDYDIVNVPTDGAERPFPNGIGVFVH